VPKNVRRRGDPGLSTVFDWVTNLEMTCEDQQRRLNGWR
jgi:hypothetical protein